MKKICSLVYFEFSTFYSKSASSKDFGCDYFILFVDVTSNNDDKFLTAIVRLCFGSTFPSLWGELSGEN